MVTSSMYTPYQIQLSSGNIFHLYIISNSTQIKMTKGIIQELWLSINWQQKNGWISSNLEFSSVGRDAVQSVI